MNRFSTWIWVGVLAGQFLVLGVAEAQPERRNTTPVLIIPMEVQTVLPHAGEKAIEMPTEVLWRPMCGSAAGQLHEKDLAAIATDHELDLAKADRIVNAGPALEAGLDIQFVLGPSVPAAAIPSFQTAEAYLESEFPNDTFTVVIGVSFAALSPGVIGGTGSSYGYVTYATARTQLVGSMDNNDVIQSYLPSGSSVPVRYRTNRTTNENRVYFTFANWKATGGTVSGNDASMQFSTNFPFDYDPADGVNPNTISLIDVIVHETGHALGFTSGVDFRTSDIEVLDLFRFRNTDGGSSDFNPDTNAEFTSRPRWAVKNNPNDDVNFDVISVEYPLSDGSPWQASHFREEAVGQPAIGIMSPAFGYGETFYPFYFLTSDLTVFDAMGYHR